MAARQISALTTRGAVRHCAKANLAANSLSQSNAALLQCQARVASLAENKVKDCREIRACLMGLASAHANMSEAIIQLAECLPDHADDILETKDDTNHKDKHIQLATVDFTDVDLPPTGIEPHDTWDQSSWTSQDLGVHLRQRRNNASGGGCGGGCAGTGGGGDDDGGGNGNGWGCGACFQVIYEGICRATRNLMATTSYVFSQIWEIICTVGGDLRNFALCALQMIAQWVTNVAQFVADIGTDVVIWLREIARYG